MIRHEVLQVTSNASATVTDTGAANGEILQIMVGQLDGNCASTITIDAIPAGALTGMDAINLVTLTGSTNDAVRYPVIQRTNAAGGSVSGEYAPYVAKGDTIRLTCASANVSGQVVTADIRYRD